MFLITFLLAFGALWGALSYYFLRYLVNSKLKVWLKAFLSLLSIIEIYVVVEILIYIYPHLSEINSFNLKLKTAFLLVIVTCLAVFLPLYKRLVEKTPNHEMKADEK